MILLFWTNRHKRTKTTCEKQAQEGPALIGSPRLCCMGGEGPALIGTPHLRCMGGEGPSLIGTPKPLLYGGDEGPALIGTLNVSGKPRYQPLNFPQVV